MASWALLKKQLLLQILLAGFLGILLGLLFPTFANELGFLSKAYIHLIKLIVNPVLFISIILGICSHRKAPIARLATKSIVYFEFLAIVTILLAFAIMAFLKPGLAFSIPGLPVGTELNKLPLSAHSSLQTLFLSMIPSNFFGTLSGDNLVSVLFLSVLFAFAIRKLPSHHEKIISFFEIISNILFKVIAIITRLAPVAIFASFATLIGSIGFKTIELLSLFLLSFSFCCLALVGFFFLISFVYKIPLFKLIVHIKEELLVALGTSSSESVFPQMMQKLESFGCDKQIVSFVMPASYAFNLTGSALYVAAASIFLQQVFHINFEISNYAELFFIIILVSKGAAGVSGAGFITLSAVLSALPGQVIPVEAGLALIVGIDPLMSNLRTIVNLIGTAQATVLLAKNEKMFHKKFS